MHAQLKSSIVSGGWAECMQVPQRVEGNHDTMGKNLSYLIAVWQLLLRMYSAFLLQSAVLSRYLDPFVEKAVIWLHSKVE